MYVYHTNVDLLSAHSQFLARCKFYNAILAPHRCSDPNYG